jgi:hypothetical protein
MEKEVLAAVMAVTSNVEYITSDRIEALTKGHGMLNLAALCAENAMTEEILRGRSIELSDANQAQLPIDHVLRVGIEAAKEAGADAANAALLCATLLNLAGANARAGVPAGNRKLGAMARLIAGADRAGMQAVPTSKLTNKVSAFPAVQAVYEAIEAGKLVRFDGATVPAFVPGGALMGHSVLGEDIVYEDICLNGTKIAVEAMMKAYRGVGTTPSPLLCAIVAAGVVLEIVNADGMIADKYGEFFVVGTSYLAGKGAMQAAGLPEKLHMRGTNREFDTARLLGDLGMILKDVGAPTVIGMMAFLEMLAAFQEAPLIGAGFSGGPVNAPLGHLNSDGVVVMQLLLGNGGDVDAAADVLANMKKTEWLDGELAAISANTVARKAEQIRRGRVTETVITATDGVRVKAIYDRARRTYDALSSSKGLGDIIKEFEAERQAKVEMVTGMALGGMFGKKIEVKFTKIKGGARRKSPFAEVYWGFDADVDAEVTIDGEKVVLKNMIHEYIPNAVLNKTLTPTTSMAVTVAAVAIQELMYVGHTIINVVVPAAVAAAMGKMSWQDAGKEAEKAGKMTCSIPGAKQKARQAAKLAVRIVKDL